LVRRYGFYQSLWRLLSLRSVEVLVTIRLKTECFRYADNGAGGKELAEDCYNRVLGKFSNRKKSPEDDQDGLG
jgi:hypothetical protein